jgi:hypothetical protein
MSWKGVRYFIYGFVAIWLIGVQCSLTAQAAKPGETIIVLDCEPATFRMAVNPDALTATACVEQNCETFALIETIQNYPTRTAMAHWQFEDRHLTLVEVEGQPLLQVKLIEPALGGATITPATCVKGEVVSS